MSIAVKFNKYLNSFFKLSLKETEKKFVTDITQYINQNYE